MALYLLQNTIPHEAGIVFKLITTLDNMVQIHMFKILKIKINYKLIDKIHMNIELLANIC